MKQMKKYVILALFSVFSIAHAQGNEAYVTDSSGKIVKSGFGLCWRTSEWTPQTANKECDPELFKEEVKTTPKVEEVVKTEEVQQTSKQVLKQPVSLVVKTFFDFDKSTLSNESKEKLQKIADEIKMYDVEVITVSGHADRIGTEHYNKMLSQRRADVVKKELVKLGVDESKIFTEAKGDLQPEVFCPGKKSIKVIACLAPNRRVKIEVIGSTK